VLLPTEYLGTAIDFQKEQSRALSTTEDKRPIGCVRYRGAIKEPHLVSQHLERRLPQAMERLLLGNECRELKIRTLLATPRQSDSEVDRR
jgi:hypothetical protein